MSYAVKEDIASEFKRIRFTGTNPVINEAEVDEFIVQASAMIDSCVCARYVLPVTDATSLSLLKKITIDIVAFRVDKILHIKKVAQAKSDNFEQKSLRAQAYGTSMDMLQAIKNGSQKLPNTAVNPETSQLGYEEITDANGSVQEPCFQRFKDQW